MASYQYIYVMRDLRKVLGNGKEVLKGVTLAFLPLCGNLYHPTLRHLHFDTQGRAF